MEQKLNEYKKLAVDFVLRLRDVRFAGRVVFVIIVLLISWSGVKTIQTNYELQKQIAVLKQQNAVQQLQNNNLELQNEYYNTNQYLELSARQNFGLAMAGEQEFLVPESVAYAYAPDVSADITPPKTAAAQPVYQSNFQSWVNFFLHRPTTTN